MIIYEGEYYYGKYEYRKLAETSIRGDETSYSTDKTEAVKKFNEDFLTSDLRQQMYKAIDGERTLQQISNDINCKINTLQVFIQQLVDMDLVDYETKGNTRIISKSFSKIAVYYANKELGEI